MIFTYLKNRKWKSKNEEPSFISVVPAAVALLVILYAFLLVVTGIN